MFDIHNTKMDNPLWNACMEYFRHQFSECKTCQNGHGTTEELVMHLSATHYRQEALSAFGKGPECQVCETVLNLPKGLLREQHILSHMMCHISLFAPREAKYFLKVVLETDCNDDNNEEKKEKCSNVSTSEDDSEPILVETIKTDLDANKCISQDITNTSFGLYWQECEDFMKKEFPRCRICQAGFNYLFNLKRHAVSVHYGDNAIKQFGNDKVCIICQEAVAPPSGSKKSISHFIKSHMVKHFDQILPQRAKPYFAHALKSDGKASRSQMASKTDLVKFMSAHATNDYIKLSNPLWQKCAEHLRKQNTMCKPCQIGFKTPNYLRSHYGIVHQKEHALELFGSGSTCAVCKTFTLPLEVKTPALIQDRKKQHVTYNHFELVIANEDKNMFLTALQQSKAKNNKINSTAWQECINFLKECFSKCQNCHDGFKCPANLMNHLVTTHYKEDVFRQFGSGDVCGICNEFKIPSVKKSVPNFRINHTVQMHMRTHLTQIMSGKAKLLLEKAIESDDRSAKITQDHKPLKVKLENTVDIPEESNDHFKEKANLDIHIKESYQVDGTSLERQALRECEQYFTEMYPNCNSCQQGHKTLNLLKFHLTQKHYGKSALELFDSGPACPICDKIILQCKPTVIKTRKEKRIITKHMSLHLEEFTVGKAKTALQKVLEAIPECVPENMNKQDLKTYSNDKLLKRVKCKPSRLISFNGKNETNQRITHTQAPKFKSNKRFTMSHPLWLNSETYFKKKFPNCKKCKKGHVTPSKMKLHLAYNHYQDKTIRLFGSKETCSICKKYSVKPNIDRGMRIHLIKMHMSQHLELYIPDEQARSLLMEAKEACKSKCGRSYKPKKRNHKSAAHNDYKIDYSRQPKVVLHRLSDVKIVSKLSSSVDDDMEADNVPMTGDYDYLISSDSEESQCEDSPGPSNELNDEINEPKDAQTAETSTLTKY